METKLKNTKRLKGFLKMEIKTTLPTPPASTRHQVSPGTLEEHIVIGHSRNSRKQHFFQGSRD